MSQGLGQFDLPPSPLKSVFFWFTKKSYYLFKLDQNSLPLLGFCITEGNDGVESLCYFF
jgi:hypothetical protein